MREKKIKREGVCKLTLDHGVFVKAHILPKSFTKPSEPGAPLMQGTRGDGFKRRWSSWFDHDLVIRKGEDILAKIDDAGIKELRHHHLIWSSWVFFKPHFETFAPIMPDHGLRKIRFRNSTAIHLFALSILWRAASSSISEMSEIVISDEKLEQLRKIVSGEKALLPHDFPVAIVQLSTIGSTHNHTPYRTNKKTPKIGDEEAESFDIVRVYLDGLIFHIHLDDFQNQKHDHNPSLLGYSDESIVISITYEVSWQCENLTILAYQSIFGPSDGSSATL